jgi:DNA-directed RNA polymerase
LAWCFECSDCFHNPDSFKTHIPIQLDGTCNGLQHYSALLRDVVGGRGVNLINSDKPNDIYANVAVRLEEKLNEVCRGLDVRDASLASAWISLGINRKLTKRPVMV